MKREKISPTIESNENSGKLALLKSGLGKTATALLLTGAIAGVSACDDGESAPVTNETVATTEAASQPIESNESINTSESSPELQEVINRYGDIDLSEKYIPKIEENINPNSEIEFNNQKFDVNRLMNDSAFLGATLDSKTYEQGGMSRNEAIQTSNRAHAEVMIALGLHQGKIANEYIKYNYINFGRVVEEFVDGKEYKVLDENATNQEILDNYDIETAILTSLDGRDSRTALSAASVREISTFYDVDSIVADRLYSDESGDPLYSHHKLAEEVGESENIHKREVLGETMRDSYVNSLHARRIYARDLKYMNTVEELIFVYYDFEGVQKWINVTESTISPQNWETLKHEIAVESVRDEVLNK